ncbi:MAG: hypothetical protein Q8S58_07300 [Bosea sp. (in: a-proteobacteria)]|uniref:hypothetical protein n=1 Tax=Bosea sp. (in: a-proteobacteria) TaxID=1871050 RepID=UPI0027351B0C|nr:hypothetical protein [Bosea sp. (in: a-proteobacteria)]MDP3256575.1 hypothetical protein [Bosea sp. (in: a-proteobacteria)]MDP3318919.1 hypothetical protein [Bosea sp. (in: a-proteobacteria)]
MNLLVHAVGAWIAAEAASGRYPRPVAVGLSMLVSRLGAPTAMMTLAAFAIKRLNQAGAFERLKAAPDASRRRIGEG